MALWQKMSFMGVDQVVKWSHVSDKEDKTMVKQTLGLQGQGQLNLIRGHQPCYLLFYMFYLCIKEVCFVKSKNLLQNYQCS